RTLRPLKAIDAANGVDAGARRVLPGHQCGARGLAVLALMVIREPHALRREAVDVGRLVIFRAVTRDVRVAEIGGEDEDEVGVRVGREGGERRSTEEKEQAASIHGRVIGSGRRKEAGKPASSPRLLHCDEADHVSPLYSSSYFSSASARRRWCRACRRRD